MRTENLPTSITSADGALAYPNEPDLLARAHFARSIARSILGWNGKESLVIALYGRWGEGKYGSLAQGVRRFWRLAEERGELKEFVEGIREKCGQYETEPVALPICRPRGINPQEYLSDLLRRLPGMNITQIDEVLSQNWRRPDASPA
jgi:hypothetical protein